MAMSTPDAQSLKAWQDAFQHPIPTVRRIEQELRRDILSNRDKLRSLVGLKYRDLLGTAQTIVDMNGEIQQVENRLSDIGMRCNPRAIEKQVEQLEQVKKTAFNNAFPNRSAAAQLALLRNCTAAISRLLRKHGSLLLVTKLLVLSRLLHKTLASQIERPPPILESLASKVAAYRHTVVSMANRRLAAAGAEIGEIVETMVAYCLVTSSSFEDVMRQFHVRQRDAIIALLEAEKEEGGEKFGNVLIALRHYIRTLQQTATLLSGRLSTALARLTDGPLLDDEDVQGTEGLGIDLLRRWVVDDVRNFTPYVRQNELSKEEKSKIIKQWSRAALGDFVKKAGEYLEKKTHILDDVLGLRKQMMEIWLPVQSSTPTHSQIGVLDELRGIINQRLESMLQSQAKELTHIGLQVSSAIINWSEREEAIAIPSLWSDDLLFQDFSDGAFNFKREVMNRFMGKDRNILVILDQYDRWISAIQARTAKIDNLRTIRWDNIVEEDDDPEIAPTTASTLAHSDPDELQKLNIDTLLKSYATLHTSLHSALANISGLSNHRGPQTAFLLRFVRHVCFSYSAAPATATHMHRHSHAYNPHHHNHQSYHSELTYPLAQATAVFADELVPLLDRLLADETVARIAPTCMRLTRELENTSRMRCVGRTLWEAEAGGPELPVQPSAAAFALLRDLVDAMNTEGADLWNPVCVGVLKGKVVEVVTSAVERGLDEARTRLLRDIAGNEVPADGEGRGEDKSDNEAEDEGRDKKSVKGDMTKERKAKEKEDTIQSEEAKPLIPPAIIVDRKIQLIFDMLYVAEAVAVRPVNSADHSQPKPFAGVVGNLEGSMKELGSILGDPAVNRATLERRAGEYWRQTRLLFGLLD